MFRNYNLKYLKQDIPAGIIVALVSIPISMGYALVAGLPPVYGLYGSLLPILVFSLLSTSPRFVFGIDAAPAALVGGMLASLGIASESDTALRIVPIITLFAAAWLFIFYLLRAGRFVRFISTPVMGGFVTGIGCTIILMQIPKLFGGSSGNGELTELLPHIAGEAMSSFHLLSFILGISTIVIIRVCSRIVPRVPMSVVMMFAGVGLTLVFHIQDHGVALLPQVEAGMPPFAIPGAGIFSDAAIRENISTIIAGSLTIAFVIVSETLLATNNFGMKHDDKIVNQREILAYACGNLAAAFSGCCPASGSVSRTGIVDGFGVKSQVMSVVASLTMCLILLFGTGFIGYLPVPILTGIVIAALMGILEFDLAHRLFKVDRTECLIFCVALAAVLVLGTIYGVIAGVILSFITFIIRASLPPTEFLGYDTEHGNFASLEHVQTAAQIRGVAIYRFTGALFFADIEQFENDLETAISSDSKIIVVDASGISSVDVTAVERLTLLYGKMRDKGIQFYLAGHRAKVNEQIGSLGGEILLDNGVVRRTIFTALEHAGISMPYPLEVRTDTAHPDISAEAIPSGTSDEPAEYLSWAFGSQEAYKRLNSLASNVAETILTDGVYDEDKIRSMELRETDGYFNSVDEDEFLDALETNLVLLNRKHNLSSEKMHELEDHIISRHIHLELLINGMNNAAFLQILKKRRDRENYLKKHHPEAYELMQKERIRYWKMLRERNPELAEKMRDIREHLV